MGRLAVFLILVLAGGALSAHADSLSLSPLRDNTLFQDADGDTSSGAGPSLFAGENSQGIVHRALLLFDVTGVPAGARVDSVVLRLYVSNAQNDLARTTTLHRVLADWGEGASSSTGGQGDTAEPGDATWIYRFYPADPWTAPGGDFVPDVSAATAVSGIGFYTWSDSGMVHDVVAWLADPPSNHGWLVQGDESGPVTARRFESRESTTPENRPLLTIYYSPESPVRPTSWGAVKRLYR